MAVSELNGRRVRATARRGITVNHRRALLNGFAACNERFQVADDGSRDAGRRHAVRARSHDVLCARRGAAQRDGGKRNKLTGGNGGEGEAEREKGRQVSWPWRSDRIYIADLGGSPRARDFNYELLRRSFG